MSHHQGAPRLRIIAVTIVGVAAISCASVVTRLAQDEGVPALALSAWRLIFACLVMVPYAAARHRAEFARFTRRTWALLAASGAFLALHFASWIASLELTSVASSVVLVQTAPVFVAVGSWLLLREPPSARTVAGIGLAIAGGVAISAGDLLRSRTGLSGDLLAVCGAVAVSGYLMIGRAVRKGCSLPAYVAVVYGVAAVILVAMAAVAGQAMLGWSGRAYALMVVLGLVPQLVGHSSFNWLLAHLPATLVSTLPLLEPIGASLLAFALLGEGVPIATALGGAVVLVGVVIAVRGRRANGDTEDRPPDAEP
jgi:drug/metabolite transporter (DMT)-like permease